jgi:hypothetical protein
LGGLGASIISDDPIVVLSNPGQIGITSFDHYFSSGVYLSSNGLTQLYWTPDPTVFVGAANFGFVLNRYMKLPLGISAGFGFSHVRADYGIFQVMNMTPDAEYISDTDEHSDNWSVGLGFDYHIRMGLGYTHKSIGSNLYFVPRGERVSEAAAYDLGMIAQVPVSGLIGEMTGGQIRLFGSLEPDVDVTLGYVNRNLGDQIVSWGLGYSTLLPRQAALGVSYRTRIIQHGPSMDWELLSVMFAREAEADLIHPEEIDTLTFRIDAPEHYETGAGDIQFFNNVILAKVNSSITRRQGLQIALGEMVVLRWGSVAGKESPYTTTGFGLRLNGVLKLLYRLSPSFLSSSIADFLFSHVDVGYDYSSKKYDNTFDPETPTNSVTSSALSVSIR